MEQKKRGSGIRKGPGLFTNNVLALFRIVLAFDVCWRGLIRIFEPIEFRVRGNKLQLPGNREWVVRALHSGPRCDVINHQTNWLGFRGENPPKNFAEYLTIFTVGGSTTHCRNISEGKTWTDLLGEKLKKSFPNLWINNAGIDGQTTFWPSGF